MQTQKNDFFSLIVNDTELLVKQPMTKPQETLKFQIGKPIQTFYFHGQLKLEEDVKWV